MRDQATSRTGFEDDQAEIGRRTRIMTKRIFSKVVWFGRATTFLVGLAVILALSVGLASTALAGTGVGSAFILGKTNTVSAISKLVGSVDGSMEYRSLTPPPVRLPAGGSYGPRTLAPAMLR